MKWKQLIRKTFRECVFKRDNHKCLKCGEDAVDAHHIQDRNLMPNGGYVIENGISLCSYCHLLAEDYHISNGLKSIKGYHPDDLYKLINSSYEIAYKASERLERLI